MSNVTSQVVLLSTDGGATFNPISPALAPGVRFFSFTPDSSQITNNAIIKVQAYDANLTLVAEDNSDNPFTISTTGGTGTHLVITPVFDSSITDDPNSAAIIGAINQAIDFYEARFADPINVLINFNEMSDGLGQSGTYFYNIDYATVRDRLIADKTSANDNTAVSTLPAGSINPVDNSYPSRRPPSGPWESPAISPPGFSTTPMAKSASIPALPTSVPPAAPANTASWPPLNMRLTKSSASARALMASRTRSPKTFSATRPVWFARMRPPVMTLIFQSTA
jgi:hypothetical protein